MAGQVVRILKEDKVIAWAEVYEDELTMLAVDGDYRDQGFGEQILVELLAWMAKTKTRRLRFVNAKYGFWAKMKTRYPKNIFFLPKGESLLIQR